MLIDTHTHLNFEAFEDDWEDVVERALEVGVEKMVVVGTDVKSSRRAVEMVEGHEALWAAVGVHPHHARAYLVAEESMSDAFAKIRDDLQSINELAEYEKVVGIGEVGLDYHVYRKSKYEIEESEEAWERVKGVQQVLLREQVQLAQKYGKPLILHSREAGRDVLKAVKAAFSNNDGLNETTPSNSPLVRGRESLGVFHCFDGSKAYAAEVLDAGFYVSFCGNITYAQGRMEVAKTVPLERLLLETDSPFMTPLPDRDLRNEPSSVRILASHHAKAREVESELVVEQTGENAHNLFGL